MKKILLTAAFLALWAYSGQASAAYNPDWVNDVPGLAVVATNFDSLFEQLAHRLVPLVNVIALLVISIAAFGMIFSQSEKQSNTARQALIVGSIGIALVWIAQTIRNAFEQGDPTVLPEELLGFAGWLRTIAVVLAVLMIIFSGIRAVVSFGSDEGAAHLRRTVIAVLVAVPLLILTGTNEGLGIARVITGGGSASVVIPLLVRIVAAFLSLVGVAAVVVIVIAGVMMIVNIGNDDQYRRARDLIIRVALGLIVIAASWALLAIIAGAMT